ncbi:MAG: hypothetical protein ACI90V_004512, partial [Bacillariaceae sp.]|jgi:hypothetical protein
VQIAKLTMKRFISAIAVVSVGYLNFSPVAFSFAPIVSTNFEKNVIFTRNNKLLRSSSLSSKSENISSDDIVRPKLPPIGDSARRLFLVRHGEVINPGGDRPVYYGAMDVSLSSLGEAEAIAAARYLQYYDLDFVVSSPLSRAIFGAEQIVALQKNLSNNEDEEGVVQMDGFKELDRGAWCGMTKVCLWYCTSI